MRAGAAALACIAVVSLAACRAHEDDGVVVIAAAESGAGWRAGVRAGDVLVTWQRAEASGELRTPFALAMAETEQGPRGGVVLRGRRGRRTLSFALPPGAWDLRVRPPLPGAAAADHRGATDAAAGGDAGRAARRWESLAARLTGDDAAWAQVQAGRALLDAARPDDARRAFGAASAARPDWGALVQEQAGDAFRSAHLPADAEASYRRALALREASAPHGLGVALCRHALGRLARVRFDNAAAVEHLEAARAIREAEAPGSPSSRSCSTTSGPCSRRGANSNRPTPSTPAPRRSWPAPSRPASTWRRPCPRAAPSPRCGATTGGPRSCTAGRSRSPSAWRRTVSITRTCSTGWVW